jgi:DNA mismatch repair protein MutL
LYLIDQHAAHECVLYERLKIAAAKQNPKVQGLLEPVVVELTWMQAEAVHEHGDVLMQYGWILEPFGDKTFLLRGVPAVLATKGPSKSFIELLDGAGEAVEFSVWEERIAATVACHGSVRAGLVLSHDEMVEMVRLLEKTQQPHTCPHGRPTMLHLSVNNLERQFGRKG